MLADYLVLMEKVADAHSVGRMSLREIQYWFDRTLAMAKRRKRSK